MQNQLKIPVDNPRYDLLKDGTLRITKANIDLAGDYECMAQNIVGEAKSRPVRMAINSNLIQRNNGDNRPKKPKIVVKPTDLSVTPQEKILLHCLATGE